MRRPFLFCVLALLSFGSVFPEDLPRYTDFSEAAFKVAASRGKVVLFFHASWCPTCRGLDKEFRSEIDSIPKDVTVLKLDYDKEKDLKKRYNVTAQTMFVQVDASMNELTMWMGGTNPEMFSKLVAGNAP